VAAQGSGTPAVEPGPIDPALTAQPAPDVPVGDDPLPQSIVSAESVLPPDTRTRVQATTEFPSSAIGLLTLEQGGNFFQCSGFLIDANTVLTAGHCVDEGGPGGARSTQLLFTPGQNGGQAPVGSCGATAAVPSPGWEAVGNEEEDWGLVQLDCLIGELVGWFGLAGVDPTGLPVHVRGYPGDRPYGTMWDGTGTVDQVVGTQAFYPNDTFGGMSGSPVFADLPACGGPCAVAVHGYGLHGVTAPHSTLNHGVVLDAARVAEIAVLAAANDRADTTPPAIELVRPGDGASFAVGAPVTAAYRCVEPATGSGLRSCTGTVANGEAVDTSPGTHTFVVTAEDGAGNVATVEHTYLVGTAGPVTATPPFTG